MANNFTYNGPHISRYFDHFGQREWERLTATPLDEISLYLHTHYLQTYLPAGARVLEIGAGAGRFTQVLAQLGARVVVADISPVQLELNRAYAAEYGFQSAVETWVELDMCEMGMLAQEQFEAVVAYGGPFSYVLDRRDQALAECGRVLKPGGRLLCSVMSLWGTIHRHLGGVLSIPMAHNRKIVATGDLIPATYDNDGHYMHMFRDDELRAWLQAAGWQVQALSACYGLAVRWDEQLSEIRQDPERWQALLDLELEACAEPGSLNMGTHIIAVAEK